MTAPMFRESTGGGWDGQATPAIRDLMGRLIFVTPVAGTYDDQAKINDDITKTWRADILVLDAGHLGLQGGPLTFGGKGTVTEPATDRINTPAFFQRVSVANSSIVKELSDVDAERTAGTSGGWLVGIPVEGKGTKGNPPVHLGKLGVDQFGRARPMAAEIRAFAEAQFVAYLNGQLTLNRESELIPPPPHASPDAHKRYQERLNARQGKAGDTMTPQGIPGAPQAPYVQPYVPPTPPAPAPVAPAAAQYAPGAPASAPPANPANPDDAVPPGYDAAAWATIPGPVRSQVWAMFRAQQQATAPAGA